MIASIASESGFLLLLAFFAAGAFGSVLWHKDDRIANLWSSYFAIIGSVWGLLFAISVFVSGNGLSFDVGTTSFPLLSLSFHVDTLSAFFVFVISLIALFCSTYGISYVKHYFGKYNIGALGFFYNAFIAGMLLVVTASNGILFLIAWELMSIASYFLVIYDSKDENNLKAGYLYLVMTHVGTAFIILSFLLLYRYTGSFDLQTMQSNAGLIPLAVKNTVFVVALIGFGTKAGIVPLHIWLPAAHPAAPSHVSGLMSGVMIKTGIYMMVRMYLDVLQPIPAWWGLVVLVVGAVSSLLGVLYALSEHDIKRLLAYHSIENIGIILLGLGSALTFTSLGLPSLALLGLAAALFHTLNHAVFKSLLFLSAGSVINQTHTRNMEEYGGLIKYMPYTAVLFLVGSMAITALPPFNGFASEWLTFQSLFQGMASSDMFAKGIFVFAAGSLAFTGGLALACFVKAFGISFLARPRGEEVKHAKESSAAMLVGMGALAALSLLFGVFSWYVVPLIEKVGNGLAVFAGIEPFVARSGSGNLVLANTATSVSMPAVLVFLLVALAVAYAIKYLVSRDRKEKIGRTWDCGTDLTPRMEITSTGFARSIVLIFNGVLKPTLQHDVEYRDADNRYLPTSRTVTLTTTDLYQAYIYQPLGTLVTKLSLRVKRIQSGNMNAYILYVFIALIVALFYVL